MFVLCFRKTIALYIILSYTDILFTNLSVEVFTLKEKSLMVVCDQNNFLGGSLDLKLKYW